MYGQPFITRAELPNIKDQLTRFAPSKPILLSPTDSATTSTTEGVLKNVVIRANTIMLNDNFAIDVSGFFFGNPLTSGTFRIRSVNVNNDIIHEVVYAPGANVTTPFYTRGMFSRYDTDAISIGFTTNLNGIAPIVTRGEFTGLDFTQDLTLQFNGFVSGTTPAFTIENALVVKNSSLLL